MRPASAALTVTRRKGLLGALFHVLALAASTHGQPEAATSGQESESRRTLQNRSLAGRSGFDRLSEATWMP